MKTKMLINAADPEEYRIAVIPALVSDALALAARRARGVEMK